MLKDELRIELEAHYQHAYAWALSCCGWEQMVAEDVLQTSILKSALEVLVNATTPGDLVDLPHEWGVPFDWKTYWSDLDEMLKEEGIQAQEWKPKT